MKPRVSLRVAILHLILVVVRLSVLVSPRCLRSRTPISTRIFAADAFLAQRNATHVRVDASIGAILQKAIFTASSWGYLEPIGVATKEAELE